MNLSFLKRKKKKTILPLILLSLVLVCDSKQVMQGRAAQRAEPWVSPCRVTCIGDGNKCGKYARKLRYYRKRYPVREDQGPPLPNNGVHLILIS